MRAIALSFLLVVSMHVNADDSSVNGGSVIELPSCGDIYSPPFANPSDAGGRTCPPAVSRKYTPTNKGLGFDILELESAICFVPDEIVRRLDEIIDVAITRTRSHGDPAALAKTPEGARLISRTIGDVLAERNYGLYIPTVTLGDALELRNHSGEPERHIFDCDTGSFIYLTVAENLGLPLSLVEITLPSGAGHNYVRWQITRDTTLDWDTNGRAQCQTPKGIALFEGKSMTRLQVLGYVYGIRASTRKGKRDFVAALADFRESIKMYPESPDARNNLAWMIATSDFEGRVALKAEAVSEAERAAAIQPTANIFDTLACAQAFASNFSAAKTALAKAMKLDPNSDFSGRQARFDSSRDCTGID